MKRVIIYGAGIYARRVYECYKGECEIPFFLVSDKKNNVSSIDKISVVDYSDIKEKSVFGDEIVVAVDEKYHGEIKDGLRKRFGDELLRNVSFLTKGEIDELYREKNPYKVENFLESVEPVSRLFGNDRGTPIDRYYIERYLEKESGKIDSIGESIEVGEDTYSKKFFPQYRHDVLIYSEGMDLTKQDTLPKEKYDVFICTQVFHEIYDVKKAIEGARYMLKEGGVLLSTVCGNITKLAHNEEYEHYWGFTEASIKKLFEGVFKKDVCVETYGNAAVATAFIQGISLEEFDSELLDAKDPEFTICISVTAVK